MQHSLSPIDADTGTVMRHSHTSGSQILVNIAHIGKVKFCVWNVKLHSMLSLLVVAQSSLECQMSKRKPATASKHAHSPKIAAKAHRANQAIVRSPKHSRLRSVAAGSTESPPERHNDSKQETPLVVENPATVLQDDCKQTMTDNDSKKGFEFSSATAKVRAYQAKLLEMAQANMQFPFEFAQRLATIRSPVEIPSVFAEFTSKRIAMFQKYSKEMAELTTKQ
jgi:hypothetical protein